MIAQEAHRFLLIVLAVSLTGCIAKDVEFTEQQKRMQRCDQYVDREREECLRGAPVTVDDYKDDYRAYQRAKEREQKENELELLDSSTQKQKDKTKVDDKPTSKGTK